MPKILLIPEFDTFGGTRTFLKNLLAFYSSQNYEVVIALLKDQLDEEIRLLLEKYKFRYLYISERKKCFKRLWFRFPFSFIFDFFSLAPHLLREKPELVVISNGTPGLFLALIMLPVRLLYIIHTYPTDNILSVKTHLLRRSLCTHKILLTVSKFSVDKIIHFWLAGEQSKYVQYVYNTVQPSDKMIKRSGESKYSVLRVLTLGHVAWYKNPELWIDVAENVTKRLNNIKLEFIWAGEGNLKDKCTRLVKKRGLRNINFIGYQSDIDSLYLSCTVYFQPSLLENHSFSVIEAMSRGIPCVVSDTGGQLESVVHGKTGFLTRADDINEMCNKVVYLLTNPKIARKLGSAAQDYYNKMFSPGVWNKSMKGIHDQLLAN